MARTRISMWFLRQDYEAIRALVPFGEDSAGKLLIADLMALRFRTLSLPKDEGCPACGR